MLDWDEDDAVLSCTQEAALREAEEAALRQRRVAAAAAQAAVQPLAAAPADAPAAAPAAPAAATAAPGIKRRVLPAILGASAAAGSGGATAPAGAAPAADENLPPARYAGRLRYAFTPTEVDWLCDALLQSGVRTVGFDIEWRVMYQAGVPPRPVALVQLCYLDPGAAPAFAAAGACHAQQQRPPQYICVLLHIAHSGLTPALRRLLQCPDVRKAGVGINGDAQKLMRDFGLGMGGCLCLSDMANQRLVRPGRAGGAGAGGTDSGGAGPAPSAPLAPAPHKWSLAGLAAALLGLRLEKSQALRCNNWEARPPLSSEQQVYAATDAWASLRVFEMLDKMPMLAPLPQPLAACPAPTGEAALASAAAAAAAAAPMAAAGDWMPALPALRHLQPAKQAVHQAVVLQGHSMEAVAAAKNIRLDSVQGYLAEAIAAGLVYRRGALGVPAGALQQAADVCGELLGQALAWQLPPDPAPAGEQQQQQQQQQPESQAAQQAGSKRPPPCSPGSLATAVRAPGCAAVPAAGGGDGDSAAAAAAAAAAGPPPPADLLELLLAAGHKMRALKEEHFPELSYGQMRLALAHLGRCNPGLAAGSGRAAAG